MTHTAKDEIRRRCLTARHMVPEDVRRDEADALIGALSAALAGGGTVAAFWPLSSEPGYPALADAVVAHCGSVLLPIARASDAGVPAPLRWAEYRSNGLLEAPYGLREPPPPWLPASALSSVRTILVPALAVDRHGVRLGRGAGYYDRSLAAAGPGARLIAVVRDDELLDKLPAEPHDVPMTHALTPGRGLISLT